MNKYAADQRLIVKNLVDHVMKPAPGRSWRLGKPGTGFDSFRVTWTPGAVMVSGDIGDAVYSVWPSFGTLWGAVELIHGAGIDYLFSKSNHRLEFDRDATAEAIIAGADHQMKWGDFDLWKCIVEYYGYGNHRSGAAQMVAAKRLREDYDLSAESINYHLGGHDTCYLIQEKYPGEAVRCYEALQLWARSMLAEEPAVHRVWRRFRKHWLAARREIKSVVFRPALLDPGCHLNGYSLWTRRGERLIGVFPFKPFGFDLSRLGLWVAGGSSMGATETELRRFKPALGKAGAA